ncbi:BREX-1 system adenine-specific DNA-methyltransferase PglX [Ruegeria arenilitoris]|uniref:BREX-1 system adenine-specific DNA-methyltransferase PglX n=1 Tax=Ruegeria arenilitoris TaxID=1173585 RepID=UPI00147BC804|nr:BREX-1 system adenine-specific DNA-methyltransferase PglX [Ruegeria arenilitoris]
MDTNALKKFAQDARTQLIEQVASRFDRVIAESSVERREHPQIVKQLDKAVSRDGRAQVIDKVAYTWFNRFTALRFMDANGYNRVRVVSPADGATRPEILAEAAAGNLPDGAPGRIMQLLDGQIPSHDAQGEAYRLLLVHDCNALHKVLPYMFEAIDDFSELLMPDDLLSKDAILAKMRAVMTEDACQDVEIIGWLYQFYISEKKDQVFAGLKKNQKITAENIPAATQLFTPHWIVRYLVENSLGRLWLLNNPHSGLAAKMDYYIAPEEPETDFLKITKPEEIRICDPAAGSGHMLTYAFDLLYAIYEEEGYDATEIPALILTHNLTGVEIDDRAGALAAFALAMKAAGKLGRRRFLRMEAKPDICVLQNVTFNEAEMRDVAAVVGKDLFTDELRETLGQFEHAKNFGSLIVPKLRDPAETLRVVEARDFGSDLLLKEVQERVLAVLRMAEALSSKYHVVVANPPYMGGKGMNNPLGSYVKKAFPDSKSDLMTAFIERAMLITRPTGRCAMVTLDSWMFLTSYWKLRQNMLSKGTIRGMAHVGWNCFPDGHTYNRGTAFILQNGADERKGVFVDLSNVPATVEKGPLYLDRKATGDCVYHLGSRDFRILPEDVIAYWATESLRQVFMDSSPLSSVATPRQGLATADNDRFTRFWSEVGIDTVGRDLTSSDKAQESGLRWFPYNKGGEYRKWYGNQTHLVDWYDDGREIKDFKNAVVRNPKTYFKPSLSWSKVTSAGFSLRYFPPGFIYDVAGCSIFVDGASSERFALLSLINSQIMNGAIKRLSPTINLEVGQVAAFPVLKAATKVNEASRNGETLMQLAKSDWDAYETSWDFTTLPLLSPDLRDETLEATYTTLGAHWQSMTDEMQALEEENNRIFIDAYGLQDELSPEVPIEEITLTCNPAYRYGVKGSEDDRETRLRADTMAEFLHYAVGCMFGRYSLDAPGLILANQGETLADYLARVPTPSFEPDEDNVIPVLDEDWFSDDIVARFRKFLRVTFGDEHFQENLRFVEKSLGKELRKYFTKDFYNDHVKRYKKRPIYWMFSSPKGTFNALIYMHRYRSDTVSVVLNDYLREFINKLQGERARLDKQADDATATQGQRTTALKDSAKIAKQIDELTDWERDVVFPLAQQRVEIDLDDGVKTNYPKFGTALKKIAGLS